MRRADLAVAVALAGVLAGCASPGPVPPDLGPDGVIITRQELTALRGLGGRIDSLEGRLSELRATNSQLRDRVTELEVRAGVAPFEPKTLTPMSGELVLPDALRVERPGARAVRKSLARHLAETRGIVVVYWATWCGPCIADEELRALHELQRQLRANGADLVSVVVDGLDKVQAHAKANAWIYPLWQREHAYFAMLPEAFVRGHGVHLPLFVVVSPSRQASWFREGALTPTAINELVNASIQARAL